MEPTPTPAPAPNLAPAPEQPLAQPPAVATAPVDSAAPAVAAAPAPAATSGPVMDVVAPPKPAQEAETLATPPPPDTTPNGNPVQLTPLPDLKAAQAEFKAPKDPGAPGVGMAIAATTIIIIALGCIALVAYLKR